MLCRLIWYSYILAVHMSPTVNRSCALQCFERSSAVKLRNGIMFDFYPGLPHIVGISLYIHVVALIAIYSISTKKEVKAHNIVMYRGVQYSSRVHTQESVGSEVKHNEGCVQFEYLLQVRTSLCCYPT